MNAYRFAATAAAACVAAWSLAACAAGITSGGGATSSPGLASSMVSVGGSIGRFPVPAGAKVAEKVTNGDATVIVLSKVTPAQVSRFYTAELPRDGFKITSNTLVSGSAGGTGAEVAIVFSGHGYKGVIGALGDLPTPVPQLSGSSKNLVGVTLTRQ